MQQQSAYPKKTDWFLYYNDNPCVSDIYIYPADDDDWHDDNWDDNCSNK